MEKDIEDLSYLIKNYKILKKNYQYQNAEMYEMSKIETAIKQILTKYNNNIPGLIKLIGRIPTLADFISITQINSIRREVTNNPTKFKTKFFSYDGIPFDTIEEAIARNNVITMGIEPKKYTR